MRAAVAPGVRTRDLDAVARDVLSDEGATSSFLNYGIAAVPGGDLRLGERPGGARHPVASDEVLREGDLISIDFGAIVDGWHGDAAITVPVGAVSAGRGALSAACEKALWDGLAAARAGGRLTDISHAVETSVQRLGPVRHRHRLRRARHRLADAHGPARAQLRPAGPAGPASSPGMALAIEPMITLGSPRHAELDDGWTVVTADGSLAAHWEHTVAILDDGPWVLTAADGGRAELAARGVGPFGSCLIGSARVRPGRSRLRHAGSTNGRGIGASWTDLRRLNGWRVPPFTHARCGRGSVKWSPRAAPCRGTRSALDAGAV